MNTSVVSPGRAGLILLLTGQMLPMIDTSITNVALDAITHSLNATATELELIVALYGVAFAVCLALGSKLGDNFGRRHLLTTYDPSSLDEGCLPPCHLLTQFNVTNEGKLDAIVYMRSVDVCLGLPTDVALYAMLLALTAQSTGYTPGRLAFMMGDTHVYLAHNDNLQEQVRREVLEPVQYALHPDATLDGFAPDDFQLLNYNFHEPIKYALLT